MRSVQERVVREIRTLRAMWRELETDSMTTAPALDPTGIPDTWFTGYSGDMVNTFSGVNGCWQMGGGSALWSRRRPHLQ
jgi:hypothetical protein